MASLKAFAPHLARILGTTPATLYERQRVLVGEELLDARKGRGPGTGVRATAESVALLLIATLATENVADAATRTRAVAEAITPGGCKFTKQDTFLSALTEILLNEALAGRVRYVSVSRTSDHARIGYEAKSSEKGKRSQFFRGSNNTPVQISATLDGTIIRQVAKAVREILDETEIRGDRRSPGQGAD